MSPIVSAAKPSPFARYATSLQSSARPPGGPSEPWLLSTAKPSSFSTGCSASSDICKSATGARGEGGRTAAAAASAAALPQLEGMRLPTASRARPVQDAESALSTTFPPFIS